jgi:hypothetical protein
MRRRGWFNFDTDRGAVLWGVLCCWLAVLSNIGLLALDVPIFYIVPWSLFGVPLAATLAIWVVTASDRQ